MANTFLLAVLVLAAIPTLGSDLDATTDEDWRFHLSNRDHEAALPLLERAALRGSAEAQFNLAICYRDGIGKIQSHPTANTWFEKSAARGFIDAQYELARSHALGRGVDVDHAVAHRWFLAAAEQGDVSAQLVVVGSYLDGVGVERDFASALTWARRLALTPTPESLLASGKITSARMRLAQGYATGERGFPIDPFESYVWFLIGNESKSDFSITAQKNLLSLLASLERSLNSEQLAEARIVAEERLGHDLRNFANRHSVEFEHSPSGR